MGSRLVQTTNTTERPFLTLFVPLVRPRAGAHAIGVLTFHCALFGTSRLLFAQHPLVVQVPAVMRLILRRETFVAGRGPDRFDFVQKGHLFRRQRRQFRRKDLQKNSIQLICQRCQGRSIYFLGEFLKHSEERTLLILGSVMALYP